MTSTENGIQRKSAVCSQHSKVTFAESLASNSNTVAMMSTDLDQIKDSNTSGMLVLKDGTITADDAAKHNQRCTSEDDSRENDPKKLYVKRKRQNTNLTNALCCKILVGFALCSIVVCFLMPVILYSVNQASDNDEAQAEYSHEKNTSSANVRMSQNISS